jgi:hypothetical protein
MLADVSGAGGVPVLIAVGIVAVLLAVILVRSSGARSRRKP